NIAELAQRFLQHPVVKKNQRVERLLLCVGGNLLSHGQMRQIKLHFQSPHFPRMLFVMIKNKSPNPSHVRLFCPHRIMIYPQHIADMIEQLARLQCWLAKLLFLPGGKGLFWLNEPPKNADSSSAFAADIRGIPKK